MVGPAWHMPLTSYTGLARSITRTDFNARRSDVLEVIEAVTHAHGGRIYAPFQHYGGRELRAQQRYLTKFPAALVALFFEQPLADGLGAPSDRTRTTRVGLGQGYLSDVEKRTALERHAVRMAVEHYWAGGATQIDELGKPYDLRVVLDGVERHVEVKGSMGVELATVQLTQGEVDHAQTY